MGAETARYNWPIPDSSDPADAPSQIGALAAAIEDTVYAMSQTIRMPLAAAGRLPCPPDDLGALKVVTGFKPRYVEFSIMALTTNDADPDNATISIGAAVRNPDDTTHQYLTGIIVVHGDPLVLDTNWHTTKNSDGAVTSIDDITVDHSGGVTTAKRTTRYDACTGWIVGANTVWSMAELQSWDDNGFTLNFFNNNGGSPNFTMFWRAHE